METPAILPRYVKLCAVLSGKALWESCGGQEVGTGQKGLKIEDGREQAWSLGATASSFMSGRKYSFQSNMLIKSLAQRSQGMGKGGGHRNCGHRNRNREELEELVCRLSFLLLKYTGANEQ